MTITAPTLPSAETMLDWEILVDGREKPLRYLTAPELREISRLHLIGGRVELAASYSGLALFLHDDEIVEDLDPAAIEFGFFGDDALEPLAP